MADDKIKTLALIALLSLWISVPYANAQARGPVAAEQAPAPRAIQCSAALELMARAAPNWSNQLVAQEARYFWRGEAERLAQAVGRNTNTEIGQEMGLLAEQAVTNPDALSSQATLCISDVPSPGSYQQQTIVQQQVQPTAQPQQQVQQPVQQQPEQRRRFGLFGRR